MSKNPIAIFTFTFNDLLQNSFNEVSNEHVLLNNKNKLRVINQVIPIYNQLNPEEKYIINYKYTNFNNTISSIGWLTPLNINGLRGTWSLPEKSSALISDWLFDGRYVPNPSIYYTEPFFILNNNDGLIYGGYIIFSDQTITINLFNPENKKMINY